jgi:hypothetical protein
MEVEHQAVVDKIRSWAAYPTLHPDKVPHLNDDQKRTCAWLRFCRLELFLSEGYDVDYRTQSCAPLAIVCPTCGRVTRESIREERNELDGIASLVVHLHLCIRPWYLWLSWDWGIPTE